MFYKITNKFAMSILIIYVPCAIDLKMRKYSSIRNSIKYLPKY